MSPYRILGLDGDASEVEIKRAYARLIRQHRPDSDPVGFQRVHEAYACCLSDAKYRAEYGTPRHDEDEDDAVEPVQAPHVARAIEGVAVADAERTHADRHVDSSLAGHVDAQETPPADEDLPGGHAHETSFDIDGFIAELVEHAHRQPARELTRWLNGHDALYSLQLKQFLSGPVANALAHLEHLPDDENVGAALAFFGLDGVGQQHPWVTHSLQLLWQRLEDRRAYEQLRRQYTAPYTTAVDRMLFRELVSQRNWLRFLAILLCPALPSRTRSLLLVLEERAPGEARARIAPATAGFWRLAADRDRLDWRRWLVVLLRLPLILLAPAYVLFVSETPVTARNLGVVAGGVAGIWFVWATATIGWRRLLRFNQEKLHWDMPLALACFMLALALLAGALSPGFAGPLCGLTLIGWFVQRNGGIYYLGLLAAVAGGAFVMTLPMLALPTGASAGSWWWVSAAVYGVASVLAADAAYARARDRPLIWARGQSGWIGWLLGAHVVLLIAVLVAADHFARR